MQRYLYPLLTLLLSSLLVTTSAEASVFRVGSDGNCTHARLADAIQAAADNGSGMDLIMVAKNHTDTDIHVEIVNQNLKIAGGFAQCGALVPTGVTTLDGAGGVAAAVLSARATGDLYKLVLQDLVIRGGESDPDGGGGLQLIGQWTVDVVGVAVRNNVGVYGGGIYMKGLGEGGPDVKLEKSDITANDATEGGGVYCEGYARLKLDRGSVSLNSATGDGGGIWFEHCSIFLRAHGLFEGVFLNDAGDQGGGVYGVAGLLLVDGGSITSNSAILGGGIALEDAAALLFEHGARLSSNSAYEGGGLYAYNATVILLSGTIDGNTAHGGAGIWFLGTGEGMSIWNTTLTRNRATGDGGGILSRGKLNLNNSTLSGNEADRGGGAFIASPSAASEVKYASFVDQRAGTGTDLFLVEGRVKLQNSLFTGGCAGAQSNRIESAGGNVDVIGRVCHSTAAHAPSLEALRLRPLAFNGGESQTHAILPGSFAEAKSLSQAGDIDQRGVDRDVFADAGAFEQDAFFGDGFESGDLSRWSASVGDS